MSEFVGSMPAKWPLPVGLSPIMTYFCVLAGLFGMPNCTIDALN